jgi:hypothetical protein
VFFPEMLAVHHGFKRRSRAESPRETSRLTGEMPRLENHPKCLRLNATCCRLFDLTNARALEQNKSLVFPRKTLENAPLYCTAL